MIKALNDLALEEVLAENTKVIVKFYADWCGICKALTPEFERVAVEQENGLSDIKFFKINAPDNPKARLLAGVYSLPFFASFENGRLQDKAATADKNIILKMIAQLNNATPLVC